jgi:hypothetical protein
MKGFGEFHGLPTRRISSTQLQLEFLAEAGPRIVRVTLGDAGENQLAELPTLSWQTPHGEFFIRGGHRLWHAPEAFPRTYAPDNSGLVVEEREGAIHLQQPHEPGTGLGKSMTLRLDPDRAALTIDHAITNHGPWPLTLAPWAITMLPLGGVAVLPQPAGGVHGQDMLPNRQIALWSYTSWRDPRLDLHDDYILVHGQPIMPPLKLGYLNRLGWLGYLRGGVFFVKHFAPQPEAPHADLGCNSECFCHELFLELETLAPLHTLEPQATIAHRERWEFFAAPDTPQTIEGVRELTAQLELAPGE